MYDISDDYKRESMRAFATPIKKVTLYHDTFIYSGTQFGNAGVGTNGGGGNGKSFYDYNESIMYAEYGTVTRTYGARVGTITQEVGTYLFFDINPGGQMDGTWTSPAITPCYYAVWDKIHPIDAGNYLEDEASLITYRHFRTKKNIEDDFDVSGGFEFTQSPSYPNAFGSYIHPTTGWGFLRYKKNIAANLGSMGEVNFRFSADNNLACYDIFRIDLGTRGLYRTIGNTTGTRISFDFQMPTGSVFNCGTVDQGTAWHEISIAWKQIGAADKNLAIAATLNGTTLTGTVPNNLGDYTFKDLYILYHQPYLGVDVGTALRLDEFYLTGSAIHFVANAPLQHGTRYYYIRQSDDGTSWTNWHRFAGGTETCYCTDRDCAGYMINTGTRSYFAQFKIESPTRYFFVKRLGIMSYYEFENNDLVNLSDITSTIENPLKMGQILSSGVNLKISNISQKYFSKEKLFGDIK